MKLPPQLRDEKIQVGAILGVSLAARLLYVLVINTTPPVPGGDDIWYIDTGYRLVTGPNIPPVPCGPMYLLYLGMLQLVFQGRAFLNAARIGHALMDTSTALFLYLIARRLFGRRAALLTGAIAAIHPAMIMTTHRMASEIPFMALFTGALALYTYSVEPGAEREGMPYKAAIAVGVLLGLATLTRAVLLLFPPILTAHLTIAHGRRGLLHLALPMLVAFAITLSPWTIINWVRWRILVIGARGAQANLYLGAREEGWAGPFEVDAELAEEVGEDVLHSPSATDRVYVSLALNTIFNDPIGYARVRISNLAEAYLQPYGTGLLSGESIKSLAAGWWHEDRTPSGLLALTEADNFWPKLLIYILHYGALIGGMIGLVRGRKGWRRRFIAYGVVAYFTGVHAVLLALPRYLFPAMPFWGMFASWAVLGDDLPPRR